MDFGEATQCTQNTQGVVDPRRMGRNNSGLNEADISDVMCILHPCSPAAFKIVASTADRTPHNVLQNNAVQAYDDALSPSMLEEQETFIIDRDAPHQAMDLALRFSAPIKNPKLGFVFGRNENVCDIVLAADTFKRVSNMHFSIFINGSGVLMLRDMSTNGTIVDDVILKGKATWHTRMLNPGSMIQILSPKQDEIVKFIIRIPSRDGHLDDYEAKFQAYMHNVAAAEARARADNMIYQNLGGANLKTQSGPVKAPLVQNQFGMHWSGGDRYNVVGLIGKGAFATVYQLATKSEGQLFAAKELEKRKFMKNGILDRKLDNEMHIMKSVSHQHIVRYVDYHDHANHMYIIMEFVPCGDLQNYLGIRGAMTEDLGKTMAAQVLDALTYLHKLKITHRDMKPDNILIADMDESNFTIKLSDFGLSKVVKDNETFLKTFCGTLLYCAPEVFPHYDSHVAGKGTKRPRKAGPHAGSKFHCYSQSVDIWSFGAVLWYSLCLKPPFEGVADNTGRGMFDKIMMTPLNDSDLRSKGVSDGAIELLLAMLNTDPAARPSAVQCFSHHWLAEVTKGNPMPVTAPSDDLGAIQEEEETGALGEPDVAALSLDEQDNRHESFTSELSVHSGSLEFLDQRESKRFKPDSFAYRDRDDMIDSSPDIFHFSGSIPIMHRAVSRERYTGAHTQPAPRPKLFGEISHSALRSSGLLGRGAGNAVQIVRSSDGSQAISNDTEQVDNDGALASPSLLGAESMVRELNMGSPQSSDSHDADVEVEEPITPRTPGVSKLESKEYGNSRLSKQGADDVTPKQPQKPTFSRQIQIPIPASFYYDPHDPSTHNYAYASKVSGRDYVGSKDQGGEMENTGPLPTTSGSATEQEDDSNLDQGVITEPEPTDTPPRPSQFVKPPPRLGKLVSTPDSFEAITIPLSSRISTWGRAPSNTNSHPDKNDTRIPKRGIIIWHHAKDIETIAEDDQAWLKLPDLHCVVYTESRLGLYVNGVLLKTGEPGRMNFGRVYTGDEIVVFPSGPDGRSGLKFVCEFYHGEARNARPANGPAFRIETTKMPHKVKGKEKENVVATELGGVE